jgi:hypothetical protein
MTNKITLAIGIVLIILAGYSYNLHLSNTPNGLLDAVLWFGYIFFTLWMIVFTFSWLNRNNHGILALLSILFVPVVALIILYIVGFGLIEGCFRDMCSL